MPELPDVQVFKEYVDATGLHERVRHVYVSAEHVLSGVSATTLRRHLTGEELVGTRRHGKHLFVRIGGDGWLRFHFGMTGRPAYWKDEASAPEAAYVRMRLDYEGGGHLAYVTTRRLGAIGLVDDPDAFIEEEGLGPDALDPGFDVAAMVEMLEGRRGTIKSALMNQRLVAGIGNVYSDEILFQAGVLPDADAKGLGRDRVRNVHRQMLHVLKASIEARVSDFPDGFLLPLRGEGGPCPKCGTELERAEISGRTSWFCPGHQEE